MFLRDVDIRIKRITKVVETSCLWVRAISGGMEEKVLIFIMSLID